MHAERKRTGKIVVKLVIRGHSLLEYLMVSRSNDNLYSNQYAGAGQDAVRWKCCACHSSDDFRMHNLNAPLALVGVILIFGLPCWFWAHGLCEHDCLHDYIIPADTWGLGP